MDFDYVIVGAGSAGCVLANRLSADEKVRVCLIEAGTGQNSPLVQWPGMFGMNMLIHRYNWAYNSTPNPATGGRSHFLPRGKGLGGSSATNAMIYIRGDASDYDTWAQAGNRGWAYRDVLPYFRRAENNTRGASEYHGADGPMRVSDTHFGYAPNKAFVDAAQQAGIPANPDFNGPQLEGAGFFQFTIDNGQRCGARAAYLDPIANRRNLTVLTNAHALRLSLEGRRARGITIRHQGKEKTIAAAREVILSAGVFGSAQILLLSGIGPSSELRGKGVTPVHDLPGVGKNLQEHPDVAAAYTSKKKDGFVMNGLGLAKMGLAALQYSLGDRSNMLSRSITLTGAFTRSSPALETPDLQLHFVPLIFVDHGRDMAAMAKHGMSLHVCLVRPESRGALTLSSPDPLAAPAIDIGLLADQRDVDKLIYGAKLCRKIMGQPAFSSYIKAELLPGQNAQSDQDLEAFVRKNCEHLYHSAGTAKMGSDPMAVVSDELKVHGMEGLRVIDASIMPHVVSSNTNAATIMIAEKGADLVLGRTAA